MSLSLSIVINSFLSFSGFVGYSPRFAICKVTSNKVNNQINYVVIAGYVAKYIAMFSK